MSNDAKKYLDSEGLSYFWDKIKDYVGEAVESGTSDIANKIHFVAPNENEATAALTAAVSDVDALSPGLVIALRMPFDSVASQTLNINNLGAKPIYYKNNTTDAGVFPSGAVVLLVYETTSVGTGCFKAVYSYDGAQPSVYQGATENANGVVGLIPAALSNEKDKFLKGDGTWAEVSTAKEVGYSTTSPTDQSVASLDDESIIFYEEDSSNVAPEVLFVSTSGNQSISGVKTFADGINAASVVASGTVSASQFTGNGSGITGLNGSNISSGTVAVERLPVYQGATTSAAGVAGLVPSAAIADKDLYLKGDGTWAELTLPSDYVGATSSASGVHGLVPAATSANREKYLRGDGTWQIPYTHPTGAGSKHIPAGGTYGQILVYSSDGTAAWTDLTTITNAEVDAIFE